jgi:hypothetical protein
MLNSKQIDETACVVQFLHVAVDSLRGSPEANDKAFCAMAALLMSEHNAGKCAGILHKLRTVIVREDLVGEPLALMMAPSLN